MNTAEVKKNGSNTKTNPDRIICILSSVTGSIFHGIREQPKNICMFKIYYKIKIKCYDKNMWSNFSHKLNLKTKSSLII